MIRPEPEPTHENRIMKQRRISGPGSARLLAATLLASSVTLLAVEPTRPHDFCLEYRQPAGSWVEAVPLGNGRLGAMVFGGPAAERIQFNEDTLWAGEPRDYSRPGAVRHLPELRRLLAAGRQAEAEDLAMREFMSVPLRQFPYQPFGDVRLEFPGHEAASGYSRGLDLDSGVAWVGYQVDGVTFRREVYASHPDQVLVIRLTADQPGALEVAATLTSPHAGAQVGRRGLNQIRLQGAPAPFTLDRGAGTHPSALRFEARLDVRHDGGGLEEAGDGWRVRSADSVTLILAAATSFVSYRDVSGDPAARCEQWLAAVADRSPEELRSRHLEDHRALFRRVTLDLGRTSAADDPTDERVRRVTGRADPQLAALFFQFGRYLLMAGSRPGSQAANLQGVWNESLRPPWDSKYTVNINIPMNYWPAEVGNLAECHEPLFDLIADVAETGAITAREHYGAGGWVLHHNTDLWRGSAPINHANHGIWVTGGAWLCLHLWDHYQFGGDREFLARRAYPLMRGAAVFFLDFLVEDPGTGWLISTPSNSPEIGGLVAGPTMDHQIIRALFQAAAEAADRLGVDAELAERWRRQAGRLAPNQIGRHGQLQEWLEDKDDPNNRHRHVSHLWGLHPGHEISPRTPELLAAARQSLVFRGDGGTGWSRAWKINLWARLFDGERAHRLLTGLLAESTLPNLFNSHPPFQIDGNFGGCAGVAEMLLQNGAGEVHLLPALPSAWPTGRVTGLRARGGFEVDIEWAGGRLTRAVIRSLRGERLVVRWEDARLEQPTTAGARYELEPDRSGLRVSPDQR